jgi:glycosyltransferase involved in cell wall biosynthesis
MKSTLPEHTPLVSIIVRTKDRPKLLLRALKSVSDQTYRPMEVILVNDGGCELAGETLQGVLGDVSLNYIRFDENRGRAQAGNAGIENAHGEYICFLDDDDELYPEHVSILVNFLIGSDYKVAYTDSLMVYKEYNAQEDESIDVMKESVFSWDFDFDALLFENLIPFMCLMFERRALINTGGFDRNFELYEDWDLLIRTGEEYPFHHMRVTTANYNQWNLGLQISQGNKDLSYLKQSYVKVLAKHMSKLTPDRVHKYILKMKSAETVIKGKDKLIHNLQATVEDKETLIQSLNFTIKDRDKLAHILQTAIDEKDTLINTLHSTMKDKDVLINDLHTVIHDLNAVLQDKADEVEALNASIRDKNMHIRKTEASLQHIYASHGWKILRKYYKLRDSLLPLGTKRRDIVKFIINMPAQINKENINKAISYHRLYGLIGLYRKTRNRLQVSGVTPENKPLYSRETLLDLRENTQITPGNDTISVIIPTKNAGDDFRHLLAMINEQKGFKEIEIIIVDSGSTDNTLVTAEEYGANIVKIKPESFTHSYSRNLGAEKASGKYLFFTVQDALLPTNSFLYELYTVQKRNNFAAVSCVEFPKVDSDLFYRVVIWNHYNKFLNVSDKDRILFKPDVENYVNLRMNGQLTDIACFIVREIFMDYKFMTDYAEDLDLGTRLIMNGHKLALLSSVKIIHSHNRSSYYYLKRGYVDNFFISDIYHDFPVPSIRLENICKDIIFAFNSINVLVEQKLGEISLPCSIDSFSKYVKQYLKTAITNGYPVLFEKNNTFIDKEFGSFLEEIHTKYFPAQNNPLPYNGILVHSILNYLDIVFEYLSNTFESIDEYVLEDFKCCLYKVLAFLSGGHIAYSYLSSAVGDRKTLRKVNDILIKGV